VLKFKAENPGTLLMIEVGYKYRFFGEDAKVVLQILPVGQFHH
jgi:DNA mismatch repair protein MSH3